MEVFKIQPARVVIARSIWGLEKGLELRQVSQLPGSSPEGGWPEGVSATSSSYFCLEAISHPGYLGPKAPKNHPTMLQLSLLTEGTISTHPHIQIPYATPTPLSQRTKVFTRSAAPGYQAQPKLHPHSHPILWASQRPHAGPFCPTSL